MNPFKRLTIPLVVIVVLSIGTIPAQAPAASSILVQCPGDLDGDAIPDPYLLRPNGSPNPNRPNPEYNPNVQCMHISGGDGFAFMADGRVQYIFSFADMTGIKDGDFANEDGDISDDIMEQLG